MYIKRLEIHNFRNYTYETVVFPHGRLVIYGSNAQGKTNLLEAIYYLSTARPFRSADTSDLIRHGETSAAIKATVELHDREITLCAEFDEKGRRLYVNGVRERRAADFVGKLKTVLFTPSDLNIVQGGSSGRRRFLDLALSQIRPRYADAVDRYAKLHTGKTRILRDEAMQSALETYNIKMSELGAIIISYRARYTQKVAEYAKLIHENITNGAETLHVSYKSSVEDPFADRSQVERELSGQMIARANEEKQRRLALVGPHRDDLCIEINGESARKYASQGQARTAALSLKLAERRLLAESTPSLDQPLLLLDDVLSELDTSRRHWITAAEQEGQLLITACEPAEGADLLTVRNGKLTLDTKLRL